MSTSPEDLNICPSPLLQACSCFWKCVFFAPLTEKVGCWDSPGDQQDHTSILCWWTSMSLTKKGSPSSNGAGTAPQCWLEQNIL